MLRSVGLARSVATRVNEAATSAAKMMSTTTHRRKVLDIDSMNPFIKAMEYAVRGPILLRAGEIEAELAKGVKKPFTEVIKANIGDCHATGQKPITFIREVLALCTCPEVLMDDPRLPEDAKQRARRILAACGGKSIGAYSDSAGVRIIRKDVAKYIAERDGVPCNYHDVYLGSGASCSIKSVLKLLMTGKSGKERAGILIPIPQYPLYTAAIAEYDAYPIEYYLNEEDNWSLNIDELRRAISEARSECVPRAIVVINPGNPTGQVLTKQNIQDIIKFAHDEGLFILSDEVYQRNIYAEEAEFHSFKKVLTEMGADYQNQELASFMSTSKCYMGECGARGGYMEVVNLDPKVRAMLVKFISINLCSAVSGQVVLDVFANPPRPGEPSYELFMEEQNQVLGELKQKAEMVSETFNSIPGMSCNRVKGSMFAFPRIQLPPKVIEAAKAKGQAPDAFYCFELLEETGICVVPGSGFGQMPGTFHFRTTILPPVEKLRTMLEKLKEFHVNFIAKFAPDTPTKLFNEYMAYYRSSHC